LRENGVDRKIRLFDDINENHLGLFWGRFEAVDNRERSAMNLQDVERWQKLERRARERGWTIDLLQASSDGGKSTVRDTPARRREFALMELGGDERALVTGDLDTIEAFL
jgi:hypothetical protein